MTDAGKRPRLRSPAFLWGPVVIQAVLIFGASSIPNLTGLPGGISDKSGHGLGYAILGAVLLRAFSGGRLSGVTWARAAGALLLATVYGMSDEVHQSFVPGRSPDVFDVLADSIGAACAVVAGLAAAVAYRWGILGFWSRSRRPD
jgi:hypothetical protein